MVPTFSIHKQLKAELQELESVNLSELSVHERVMTEWRMYMVQTRLEEFPENVHAIELRQIVLEHLHERDCHKTDRVVEKNIDEASEEDIKLMLHMCKHAEDGVGRVACILFEEE